MTPDTRERARKRVRRIAGQVAGIERMIDEDRYCVDVIRQTYAIRRALQKLEGVLIDGHLRSCVPDAYREGRDDQMLDELKDLFEIAER